MTELRSRCDAASREFMVFDHDAGTGLFAIFLGTLADIGTAAAVIYLLG